MISFKDDANKSNQSSVSLKNGSSDSSSDHSPTVRPRAIDNSSLVAASSVKVLF